MDVAIHSRVEAASSVLRKWAPAVDEERRFPHESITALREGGLLGLLVPKELGGYDADYQTLFDVASALGGGCASTALIFAMHASQVAMLRDARGDVFVQVLREVAASGVLIASVTSERDGPSDALNARAPIVWHGSKIEIKRSAPHASYALEADYLIVKMRASIDSPASDVVHVLMRNSEGSIASHGAWRGMGVRGTQTVPVSIEATLPADRVIPCDSATLALKQLLPCAHIAWAGVWYGVAKRAFHELLCWLRRKASAGNNRSALTSAQTVSELSAIHLMLSGVRARALLLASRLDQWNRERVENQHYRTLEHRIEVNELKVAASEDCFRAVDRLIGVAGVRGGYLTDSPQGLERAFRDLRSAPLMYGNGDLLHATGTLVIAGCAGFNQLVGAS